MDKCCNPKLDPAELLAEIKILNERNNEILDAEFELQCSMKRIADDYNISYYDLNDLITKLKRLAMEQL